MNEYSEQCKIIRNEKREYLKGKINELAMNSKKKNIRDLHRGISEFKWSYQSINNLVKYENGDLLADFHNTLNRRKSYFSHLLNVQNVSDVRQIEVLVHSAEQLVPGPSHLEVEIATAKLKKYKSPGSDQIPAELIQAGVEILLSAIHKLVGDLPTRCLHFDLSKYRRPLSGPRLYRTCQYKQLARERRVEVEVNLRPRNFVSDIKGGT
jgi:hypothetical protein